MTNKSDSPSGEPVRRHSFDGIQEYDNKLPNWWLTTFYGAIVFAICYWIYYAQTSIPPTDQALVTSELNRIQAAQFSANTEKLDDDGFWKMSRNPNVVAVGQKAYATNCASCHGEKMTGGIGPNLLDKIWLHGGSPTAIYTTVTSGVAAKGMPTWGPVLGAKKISEVVAFIVSKHESDEPEMRSAHLAASASSNHASAP